MAGVIRKLNKETFVLNFRAAMTAAPALPGYVSRLTDDHTLEIEVSKEQSLNDIFARLTQQDLEVVSMRNKVNRLEELFMRLVESKGAAGAKAG
jgi:ABC-2 type transport system ATP-binding protein